MRHTARPVPQSTKSNAVAGRMARIRPLQFLGDEQEHRADRVLSFRGMRKRLLRRFPRTDLHA